MMAERGVQVDHSNIYRWVQKFTPKLEATFRKGKKRPVGKSWRMDETYIKGQWKYLYRAVDKEGQTVDFLLTIYRDKKAIRQYGLPDKMTIDKGGANTAALDALNDEPNVNIEVRQSKYLNNLIEQDHRAIKRIVRPMLGLKSFRIARITLQGIELMHMIKKGQMVSGLRPKSICCRTILLIGCLKPSRNRQSLCTRKKSTQQSLVSASPDILNITQ